MAIVMFTDFGAEGPYLGQMESVIEQIAPGCKVINLLSNAPKGDPYLSAYLLAALSQNFPENTIFLAVVDPGVGGQRDAVVLEADGKLYIGPDNGLFNTVAVYAKQCRWHEIIWRPPRCSTSFHGRDIFAPVAAKLAINKKNNLIRPFAKQLSDWEKDLPRIIYFDHYGNAMTGIRYQPHWDGQVLLMNNQRIEQASTFCDVPIGTLLWYNNSSGLIEIAANQDNAKRKLNAFLGNEFTRYV